MDINFGFTVPEGVTTGKLEKLEESKSEQPNVIISNGEEPDVPVSIKKKSTVGKAVSVPTGKKVNVMYDKVNFLEVLCNEVDDERDNTELVNRLKNSVGGKYVNLMIEKDIKHWKLVTTAQLVRKNIFPMFGPVYREFLKKAEYCVFMFNMQGKLPIALVIRGLNEKEFYDVSIGAYICYGMNELPDDFRYGDEIFLTEGLFDKEVADLYLERYRSETGRRIHALAILTSSVTNKKAEMLSMITNRFILNPDNDSAGERSSESSPKMLKHYDCNCAIMETMKAVNGVFIKDMGDCYPMNDIIYIDFKKKLDKLYNY